MLRLLRVVLGYCQMCGAACQVGVYQLAQWPHQFLACAKCLRNQAAEVERGTPQPEATS